MNKNKKRINILIKRKGLFEETKKKGIRRISKEGEKSLNNLIFDSVEDILKGLKEQMDISGKRVLDEEIVKSFIEEKESKEDFDY
jgi:hypothetical protein